MCIHRNDQLECKDTEAHGQFSDQSQGAYCEHVFILNNKRREFALNNSWDMFNRPVEVCDKS